ncbi:MAG: cereblon family protein [Kofleriaceae bacterium]
MAKERADADRQAAVDDAAAVRCAPCAHRLSERAYRSEINGAHEHTFVNPGGFLHHLGCFVAAPGCIHVGATEQAFTWFPGWSWQVALCGQCRAHVGWLFRCGGGQLRPPLPLGQTASGLSGQFHGLILAMLRA